MPTPASRRVREPLHEQGLCNGYGRGKMWLLRREPDSGGLTRTGPDGAVDNERRGSLLSLSPRSPSPFGFTSPKWWALPALPTPATDASSTPAVASPWPEAPPPQRSLTT